MSFIFNGIGFGSGNLTLRFIEGISLENFTCLSIPANARKRMKFKLYESELGADLWERFTSLFREKPTASPLSSARYSLQESIQEYSTSICAWASPIEPGLGLAPSHVPHRMTRSGSRSASSGPIVRAASTSFCRLQQLCTFLGGTTIQELFIEY